MAVVTVVVALALTVSPGSNAEAQRIAVNLDLSSGELSPVLVPEPHQGVLVTAMPVTETQPRPAETASVQNVSQEQRQRAARIASAAPSGDSSSQLIAAFIGPDAGMASQTPQNEPSGPQAAPEPKLTRKTFEIQSGDTLSRLFSRAGLNDSAMYRVLRGEGKASQLGSLRQGQEIEFVLNEDGELQQLSLQQSRTKKLQARLTEDRYVTREVSRDPEVVLAYAGGEIESSFALSARRAGLGNRLSSNLANIFGWQVDFGRDLRRGDRFAVLYEEHYLDGEKVGYGRILSAYFRNRGEEYTAVLYTDNEGRSEYFTPEGKSLRKAFIRAPLDYRRVSSRFDPQRRHPILNRVRPHEGTDFAASIGTPVRAAGDGRVRHARRDGGYGRTVRIQHGNGIETVYAHLHNYARGLREGQQVRQGQVIGYVGMSGLASGPHLHYEYRHHGRPKDPMRVALPDADPVRASQMAAFQTQTQPLMAQLATRDESFQVAMAEE
ncbi:MAG: peptidoglycan DD-metalloendopeptidase family protein [Oleiphilaceae bacterium]|nr:peptidoglycan DD-metalloendopeptidase family protein [Oleiphilaceae bacterium]